jgi:D-3-phosphoglycerate dehydrogenase
VKYKILIGPSSFAEFDKTPLNRLIEAGYEVVENPYKRKLTEPELVELLQGVVGIIAGLEPLNRAVLSSSTLKVISRCGSGMSNVDIQAAKSLGIIVRNTPLGPTNAVAELTIGCLLSLLRNVPQMNQLLHEKKWSKRIGRQLSDACIAVIGLGNIGKQVVRLLTPFGVKIIAVEPLFSGTVNGIPVVEMDEALGQADIITLHASGDHCLLGDREFDMMKTGVYVLNAARGSLIDENALKRALDSKKVIGAWIDTYQKEPYDGIFCDYDQVILTPHIGSYTAECRSSMELESVDNLIESFRDT